MKRIPSLYTSEVPLRIIRHAKMADHWSSKDHGLSRSRRSINCLITSIEEIYLEESLPVILTAPRGPFWEKHDDRRLEFLSVFGISLMHTHRRFELLAIFKCGSVA